MMTLGNVITAIITPFNSDLTVNYDEMQKLALHLFNNGSDAVVVCGTTGESPNLSHEEKINIIRSVKAVAQGKGLVIAGTSSYNTSESVIMTKAAEAAGADGILAVCPYYNKPPQDGIYAHLEAIARATVLPVVIYNIPSRTGINLNPETLEKLVRNNSNIVAIKESSGNMEQVSEIKYRLGSDIMVYSGDDYLLLPMLSLGAEGVISVASHLVGNDISELIKKYKSGDVTAAMEKHYYLWNMFRKLFITSNPIPIKYCLRSLGWNVGYCRLPLTEPKTEDKQALEAVLLEYGLK